MEDPEKNPVLDRLVQFINSTGLSSSQFADTTGIPRPSLSQMLHGRNKSVNNQVLSKLNSSFPNLNILWLLFGQGTMLLDSNIEISGAQNQQEIANNKSKGSEYEPLPNINDLNIGGLFSVENSSGATSSPTFNAAQAAEYSNKQPTPQNLDSPTPSLHEDRIPTDNAKKISSIIVLYSDGSFETFKPSEV